jgi:hypothetical protein
VYVSTPCWLCNKGQATAECSTELNCCAAVRQLLLLLNFHCRITSAALVKARAATSVGNCNITLCSKAGLTVTLKRCTKRGPRPLAIQNDESVYIVISIIISNTWNDSLGWGSVRRKVCGCTGQTTVLPLLQAVHREKL